MLRAAPTADRCVNREVPLMRALIRQEWFAPILAPVIFGILALGLWQFGCRAFSVPIYLLPAPTDIAQCLLYNWPALLHALGNTLSVTLTAFILAVFLGVAAAFMLVQSRWIEMALLPYAVLLQATPVVAVAPLIIILIKNTSLALIACTTVIALFPIITNTTIGLRSADPALLANLRMNNVGRTQTLWRLRLQSALPFFMVGLRISSGLAFIGAVVAEFIAGAGGRGAGLAYVILQSSFQLDIPRIFASLLLIGLTGLALFGTMAALNRLLLRSPHGSPIDLEK
jgi:NitT/TauT family transport system permease protein